MMLARFLPVGADLQTESQVENKTVGMCACLQIAVCEVNLQFSKSCAKETARSIRGCNQLEGVCVPRLFMKYQEQ